MQPIALRVRAAADNPVAAFILLTVAYTAASCVGLRWATVFGAASPVWPASGVALAGLILGGVRLWPAIVAGRLMAAWLMGSHQPFWADFGLAIANTLAAVLPLLVLQRRGGIDPALPDLPQLLRFFAWGGLFGALIAASLGTVTVFLSSGLTAAAGTQIFLNWLVAYFVGAILIGPLILSWLVPATKLSRLGRLHLGLVLVITMAFASMFLLPPGHAYLRTWHVFPVLVWAALVFELRGATLAVSIVAVTAVWATDHGLGPMTAVVLTEGPRVSLVQQFIASTTLTILVLAVVASERRGKQALAVQSQMLQRAEEEARARAEELQVVLSAVPAAIWVARDPQCRQITGNQQAATLLRLPSASANMSRSNVANAMVQHFTVLDRDGRELAPDDLPVQRAARGEVVRDFEERVLFSDGTAIDLLGNATPLYTPEGALRGAVAAFIDITERKAAESREHLLSREVDHRAKNIMAVIQAIVQLTEAKDIGSFRKAISGRISSLARSHTLLAQNRWDGAELRELIEEELAPYLPRTDALPRRVTLDGPRVQLLPLTAQSIALVIHELITNALKHGSLSTGRGTVQIDWRIERVANERELTLCWCERGGPFVSAPGDAGFGLSLIEATVKEQLSGKLVQSWDQRGLTVEFVVPAAKLFREADAAA